MSASNKSNIPSLFELTSQLPMIYVIIVILYIEIFLFMFNPKIKTQILLCAVPVTTILFMVILTNAVKSKSANLQMAGAFIGIMTIVTCIGILNTAISEYKTDVKKTDNGATGTQLSKKNEKTVKRIKGLFITNVIITAILGFMIAPDTQGLITKLSKSINTAVSIYTQFIQAKTKAINGFIHAHTKWWWIFIYCLVFIVTLPLTLTTMILERLFDTLTDFPQQAFAVGVVYIFSSSVYIMAESTKLTRLVIPE